MKLSRYVLKNLKLASPVVFLLLLFSSISSANQCSITWDSFKKGFSVTSAPDGNAENAKWFYFSAGPFVGDDGITSTKGNTLTVKAKGTNVNTGEPAFTKYLAQEGVGNNPYGLPGGLDHVKWLVYMNHFSSSGFPGFSTFNSGETSCETWMRGRSYGTQFNPYGAYVSNANNDLRLASSAMNTIDFKSFMVFDFFVTNEQVFVFYERLPFGRGATGNGANYAAFSFMIPVAKRSPNDLHHMKIAYDKSQGVVRWILDDEEVFKVDKVGFLIDRKYMVLDHGGVEEAVTLDQLACGMGMFTLLDAHSNNLGGLVKLSTAPGFYFNPQVGQPTVESFLFNTPTQQQYLFGQGASLDILKYKVTSPDVCKK